VVIPRSSVGVSCYQGAFYPDKVATQQSPLHTAISSLYRRAGVFQLWSSIII